MRRAIAAAARAARRAPVGPAAPRLLQPSAAAAGASGRAAGPRGLSGAGARPRPGGGNASAAEKPSSGPGSAASEAATAAARPSAQAAGAAPGAAGAAVGSTAAASTAASAAPATASALKRFSGASLLVPSVFTGCLGYWQVCRWFEKMDLLERRKKRLAEPPLVLSSGGPSPAASAAPAASAGAGAGAGGWSLWGRRGAGPAAAAAPAATPDVQDASPPPGGGHAANGAPGGRASKETEYRRVLVEGTFDEAASQFVGPRAKPNASMGQTVEGYVLITPLRPDGGGPPVLVNRGWVPAEWRKNAQQQQQQQQLQAGAAPGAPAAPAGKPIRGTPWGAKPRAASAPAPARARVVGVVRPSEAPNAHVPANVPSEGRWFWIDAPALAEAAGLPRDAMLVEALRPEEGGPVPAPAAAAPLARDPATLLRDRTMPQDHLNYAATWFLLSGATLYMASGAVRGRSRNRMRVRSWM